MTSFIWNTLSQDEAVASLATSDRVAHKKRIAAYERALETSTANSDYFRKTTLTVAEEETLSLPPLEAMPGITVIEICVKPHASLQIPYLHTNASASMTIMRITLEEGASVDLFAGIFGGTSSSLIVETTLAGAHSSTHQRTVFFGDEAQNFDIFSNTTLTGESTTAMIEQKGVLLNRAQARFDGNIIIKNTAHKADAKLLEHTLLLSSEARVNAIPGLTIETNDVRASHAASVTRIDDEQLFYCKSRGIEEREGIALITEGFLKTIYANTPFEKNLDQLIEEKLCRI